MSRSDPPRRCYCVCHRYPGIYPTVSPCKVCGHVDSDGSMPGTINDGWEPNPPAKLPDFVVAPEPTVKIIGPFRGDVYRLAVDECEVPYVYLYKRGDTPGFEWTIKLDNRFEIDVTEAEVLRWAWLMANAMAISAGFTYHGPNSQPINRHRLRMVGLSSLDDLERS